MCIYILLSTNYAICLELHVLTLSMRLVMVEVPCEVLAETVGAFCCHLLSPGTHAVVRVQHSLHDCVHPRSFGLEGYILQSVVKYIGDWKK